MSNAKLFCFVYGTLKAGKSNNHLLEKATFVREAVTKPIYRLWNVGRYPALTKDLINGKAIQGEIWEITPEILVRLDRLEGVPWLYVREVLEIEGAEEEIQGYIYNREYGHLQECSPVWNG